MEKRCDKFILKKNIYSDKEQKGEFK